MRFSARRSIRILYLAMPMVLAAAWLQVSGFSHPREVAAATDAAGQRQPVLVELFTSEGCSSCPPADALLAQLEATQFVPGAQAIVLSEHVTYWNHLGWRDPYSTDAMTDRQQRYATWFALDSVYTPQAVIDGAAEVAGGDAGALSRAVAHATVKPKAELTIDNVQWTEGAVHFTAHSTDGSHAKLVAALAQDATQSTVARGENAGRTLHHVAVVRVLQEMGAGVADGRALTLKLPSHGISMEKNSALRMVVFLTDHNTGRVVAVAEREITR